MDVVMRQPSSDSEWIEYFNLRYEVLRQPWNQPPGSEKLKDDDEAHHFAAFAPTDEVVGVVSLHKVSLDLLDSNPPRVKSLSLRMMGVKESYQGAGVGRKLVEHVEQFSRTEINVDRIVLDARENAVKFYENLGYKVIGESYLLFNSIQHFKMEKFL